MKGINKFLIGIIVVQVILISCIHFGIFSLNKSFNSTAEKIITISNNLNTNNN